MSTHVFVNRRLTAAMLGKIQQCGIPAVEISCARANGKTLGRPKGVLLSDVYHPGTTRGPGPIAWQVSSNVLQGAGFDVLREFWPETARKFHVPFGTAFPPRERPAK